MDRAAGMRVGPRIVIIEVVSPMKIFAPLIALAALSAGVTPASAQAIDWTRGKPIDVTVTNDRFIPARITMRRGTHYILRIHNRSDRKHNFSAPQFFGMARVAPRDSGWVTDDKVDLAPRQSAVLHIIAPDAANASYRFRSTNLLDATEKMKGEIIVR